MPRTMSNQETPPKPRRAGVYPLPMAGFMAQLVIPIDLSEAEAARLSAFIKALVVPWNTEPPTKSSLIGGGVDIDAVHRNPRWK